MERHLVLAKRMDKEGKKDKEIQALKDNMKKIKENIHENVIKQIENSSTIDLNILKQMFPPLQKSTIRMEFTLPINNDEESKSSHSKNNSRKKNNRRHKRIENR